MDQFVVQEIAFYLKEIVAPLIVIVMTAITLIAAYRRGLFNRARLPTEEARTVIVHGDVVGGISTGSSNLQEIALDASKVDEYHRQSIARLLCFEADPGLEPGSAGSLVPSKANGSIRTV